MSTSRIRHLSTSLTLVGSLLAWLAVPALAQNSTDTQAVPPDRDASFLTPEQAAAPPAINVPVFSGLATEPPTPIAPASAEEATARQAPPPAAAAPPPPSPPVSATPVTVQSIPSTPPIPAPAAPAQQAEKPPDIIAPPVSAAPLPDVSSESVGTQSADSLGAGMWKDTPREVANSLLSIAAPTSSSALNALARRLLMTAAVPPEGTAEDNGQGLTSLRVQKLVAFGAAPEAWTLAKHADAKLIDDATFEAAAENLLATDGEDICGQLPDLTKAHSGANWQKDAIICQLRAKDTKAAQVGLDVMRALRPRDNIFLEIADKNILGSEKNLPFQLTPLTASTLALLRLTGKPLPGELYGRPDLALAPALMHTSAKQDVAQLGLAEHAAERGLISSAELAAVYRTVTFTPEQLASPLTAHETGLRERALFFRAADGEKDAAKRIAYAIRFTQSASPAFLNGVGAIVGDMLGAIKPDPIMQENAATVAWIYMLANRGDAALDWLRLARSNKSNADILQHLWPQFALAGLEADSDYGADFDKWLASALTPASPQDDPRLARDSASTMLLLLDAAGFKVPDAAWAKVLAASHNEKHIAFSPVLFDRLGTAGIAGRRAETVLTAVGLAGDGDISLPAAVTITRALREAGFKSEASLFARQMVAILTAKQS